MCIREEKKKKASEKKKKKQNRSENVLFLVGWFPVLYLSQRQKEEKKIDDIVR